MTVVFLGPSLERAAATEILPDATFLPPVCQGQLMSAVQRHRPDVVAIIDGEFCQTLSVWHKEILYTLGEGVRVVGASSMGALRAAECAVYGMEGVGRIYEWYRSGELTDDDEVALLHGHPEEGWRSLSWPMVNVRSTLARLCADGVLEDKDRDAVAEAAKSLYFPHRTEREVGDALVQRGRADGPALAALVAGAYVDQKRLDAVEALTLIADGLGPAAPIGREPRDRIGWLGRTLQAADTEVVRQRGTVLRHRIIDDAALHEADFEAIQERALHRALVAEYADELGFEPSADDIAAERARFLARRELDDASLDAWLRDNDADEAMLHELLVAEARTRRLRSWYLQTRGYERNRREVATQLRLEGRYPEIAERAARRATLADAARAPMPSDPETARRVIAEQQGAAGWRPSLPLQEWLEEFGFGTGDELLMTLADLAAARREAARRRARTEGVLAVMMEPGDGGA